MTPKPAHSDPVDRPFRIKEYQLVIVVLFLISWLTNFCWMGHFGLYEDDYIWVMTLPPLNWSAADLHAHLAEIWSRWIVYQGRPIGFSFNVLLAYAGRFFPSLVGSYVLGYVLLSFNAVLIFLLATRFAGRRFAWVVALAFIVFPADASKQILMHRLLHLSEFFLLIALLLYQRGHRWLSYGAAALTLLTYEALYLPFILAPVIACDRWPSLRRILGHIFLFAAIALILLRVRSSLGDDRTQLITVGLGESAGLMVQACFIGLKSVLANSLGTAVAAYTDASVRETWLVIAAALVIGGLLYLDYRNEPAPIGIKFPRIHCAYAGLFLLGIAFTFILAFRPQYFPPTATIGRASGVNMAAAIPFALLVGSLFQLGQVSSGTLRRIFSTTAAVFLAGWLMHGMSIQRREYALNWEQQQKPLWRLLVQNSGSFEQGAVILVEMNSFPRTKGFDPIGFIGTKTFNAFEQLVLFPDAWKLPPRVYGYAATSPMSETPNGPMLHSPEWNKDFWPILKNDGFYAIRFRNGQFEFQSDPVTINGATFTPRLPAGAPRRLLRPGGEIVLAAGENF